MLNLAFLVINHLFDILHYVAHGILYIQRIASAVVCVSRVSSDL